MNNKSFFGYKAAVGAFLVIFVNLGVCSTLGVFMGSLAEYSGWDLGTVGLIGTVNTIGNVVLSILAVQAMKRLGNKVTMLISVIACALHTQFYCFVTPGQNVPSLAFMYIAGFLASFAITFGTHAVCGAVIAEWFVEKRGSITGIVFSGAGFGAAIWVFLAGQLFKVGDYKFSYRIIAVLTLIIGLFAIFFLIKSPEKLGQTALGAGNETDSAGAEASEASGVDKASAMKSPAFWILAAALLCIGAAGSAFMAYAPAAWQAGGWSATEASNWDAVYLLLSGAVLLVVGKITAKLKPQMFAVLVGVAYIITAVLMSRQTSPVMGLMVLIVIFAALAYPLNASIPGLMGPSIFGAKDAAAISATLMTAVYIGQALYAPIMAAFLGRENLGFPAAWIFFAVLGGIGTLLLVFAVLSSPLKKAN